MRLENTFTVPGSVDTTWETLLDLERVATCVPGATLHEVDGDTFAGRVGVKLGPVSMAYQAKGRFVERDRTAGQVVIEGSGREDRGNGTARATVTLKLAPAGVRTRCSVVTDLAVTGRPAQFGRGLLQDVSNKLVEQFAVNLERELAQVSAAPVSAVEQAAAPPHRASSDTPLDLGRVALGPVLRRGAPVAVALVGAILALLVVRRSRGRR